MRKFIIGVVSLSFLLPFVSQAMTASEITELKAATSKPQPPVKHKQVIRKRLQAL